jgi:hypothetical protein
MVGHLEGTPVTPRSSPGRNLEAIDLRNSSQPRFRFSCQSRKHPLAGNNNTCSSAVEQGIIDTMSLRTGDDRAKAGHEFGKNSANRYAEPAKDSLSPSNC